MTHTYAAGYKRFLTSIKAKNTGTAPHPPTTGPQPVQSTPPPNGDKVSELFIKWKEGQPGAQQTLHNILHTTLYFQILLCLLTFIAIGSAIGLFVETFEAYVGNYPYTWWTQDWHLWPDIVATLCVLTLALMVAIVGPISSNRLTS